MYERHFGLAGPPFRLSPDPEFLFAAENHRELLAAMRQIFRNPLPVLAISGEMGSGKTTILRYWLDACRAQGVIVAHLVNTQLDADELMQAVAIQFGAAGADDLPHDASRAPQREATARVRRHFLGLAGRFVLLAIDEAQNLSVDALACLVGLTESARETRAAFRICLTGQPELRTHLDDAALGALRSRIQRLCHLGAFGPTQTQRYIEHRLLKVGWVGVPSFDAAALEEIHRFTEGVPRRINLLANRLLLSQMLSGSTRVDAPCVVTVARALRAEVHPAKPGAPDRMGPGTAQRGARGTVMLVASGRSDHIKAVPLLQAIQARADLPQPLLVSASSRGPWQLDCALREFIGLAIEPIALSDDPQPSLDDLSASFEEALDTHRPRAVIVFDGNPPSQCCAMICRERDVPLVHVGSDAQGADERFDAGSPRAAIARLADLRFTCQPSLRKAVFAAGAPTLDLGNPLIDAVRFALQFEMRHPDAVDHTRLTATLNEARRGYGLVALTAWDAAGDDAATLALSRERLTVLRQVSRDLPLVWPMHRATASRLGLARLLQGCQVTCIDELGHAAFVNLLRDATCVLTDCLDVTEEAAALHVPAISLGARHVGQAAEGGWLEDAEAGNSVARATRAVWQIVFNGGREIDTPPRWDGHAAPRLAACLAEWFGSTGPAWRRSMAVDEVRAASPLSSR